MITVELSPYEMLVGSQIGCIRNTEAVVNKCQSKNGTRPEDNFKISIMGALGELAVAKALKIKWTPGINTFKDVPDLLPDIEVRCRSFSGAELIYRPDDCDDRKYVLVTGVGPKMVVRGWMRGKDCRKTKWWADPNNRGFCWWVPQDVLRPLEELMTPAGGK